MNWIGYKDAPVTGFCEYQRSVELRLEMSCAVGNQIQVFLHLIYSV
jgi:hypothetical protein